MIAELLADSLQRHLLMMLWLLPCAIRDRRTQRVSNGFTMPPFILAWPAALLTGNLSLTVAVFVGVFVAWRWSRRLGAADGKIAVGLASIAPPALAAGVIVQALAFLYARLRGQTDVRLPGAVAFYLGAVIAAIANTLALSA